MDEQMIEPCGECKALCRIEVFGPNPAIEQPVSLWMCSNHKSFGGDCPSDIAYFDAAAWNAAHSVIAGKVAELTDEVVELWHQAPDESRSLQECLHMTDAEYSKWANPDALAPYPERRSEPHE